MPQETPKALREGRRDQDHSRAAALGGAGEARRPIGLLVQRGSEICPPEYSPTNSCGSRFSTSGLSCKRQKEHKAVSLAPRTRATLHRDRSGRSREERGEGAARHLRDSRGSGASGAPAALLPPPERPGRSSGRFGLFSMASSRDRHPPRLKRRSASHHLSPEHLDPPDAVPWAAAPEHHGPELPPRKQEVATFYHETPKLNTSLSIQKRFFLLLV